MKSILCYGDSNTWGYEPATARRFGPEVRWTGVLQQELGGGWRVIEEGLNGRTTVLEDPIEPGRCGRAFLPVCLESHAPLDLVVLMLGTNDLKRRFDLPAADIADGAAALVDVVQAARGPGLLLLAPPPVGRLTELAEMFEGAEGKSRRFGGLYARVAQEKGCAFLDAGTLVVSSDQDGIHLEAGEHAKLGRAVAREVRRLLG